MTWIDERLFGWSHSASRGTSVWGSGSLLSASNSTTHSEAPSTIGTPNDTDDEDGGDYDPVLRVINDHHFPQSPLSSSGGGGGEASNGTNGLKRPGANRSRQGSYADLQRLKMSAPPVPSPVAGSTGVDVPDATTSDVRHRARRPSLSDSIPVESIGKKSNSPERFEAVTKELNEEAARDT